MQQSRRSRWTEMDICAEVLWYGSGMSYTRYSRDCLGRVFCLWWHPDSKLCQTVWCWFRPPEHPCPDEVCSLAALSTQGWRPIYPHSGACHLSGTNIQWCTPEECRRQRPDQWPKLNNKVACRRHTNGTAHFVELLKTSPTFREEERSEWNTGSQIYCGRNTVSNLHELFPVQKITANPFQGFAFNSKAKFESLKQDIVNDCIKSRTDVQCDKHSASLHVHGHETIIKHL